MAETGMAETGADAIGVAETGAVAIGVAATGTTGTVETGVVAIGVAATGTIGTAMISFSLVASDFRGGGVGVIRMDIMEATHMVMGTGLVTAMEVTRMGTVMGLATAMIMALAMEATNMVTVTAMEMEEATNMAAPAMEMDTATVAGPELPSYSAGSLALVIITGPLTASWDHERVEQFARINRTTATPGNAKFLPFASRASGSFDFLLSRGSLVFSGALIAGAVVVHQ
jgi:hypothetical protein